jgi:hypothetical protein
MMYSCLIVVVLQEPIYSVVDDKSPTLLWDDDRQESDMSNRPVKTGKTTNDNRADKKKNVTSVLSFFAR